MAKRGQPDVFLIIDGFDITGDTFELSDEVEALTEQSDCFGDSWVEEAFVGMKRSTITHRSYYDDAVGRTHDALVALQGNPRVLTAGLAGNIQGRKAMGFPHIIQSVVHRQTERAQLQKIAAEYAADEKYELIIVQPLAADAGNGVTPAGSVDLGADIAAGVVRAFLQVTAITLGGYTNVTVKLQDSDDDVIFADLVTFSPTTARSAQSALVTPPVEQYVQAVTTWGGAGAGESVTLLVAIGERDG